MFSLIHSLPGFKLYLVTHSYSPITIHNYLSSLTTFANFLNNPLVSQITQSDILNFFEYLRQNHRSESTIQAYWKIIRSYFNWASDEFHFQRPDNIPMPQPAPSPVYPFSVEEIQKLTKACKTPRDKAIILLLLDTGLRVSEAARLTIKDVDLETGTIHVRPWRTGKKSRPRIVKLGNSTRRALWTYIASRNLDNNNAPLIATCDEKPLDRYAIGNIIERIAKRAGVFNCHPHRFRHTFAIFYLRNGGDIFTLQELLGHASLDMVRLYLRLSSTDLEQTHRRASPVDNLRL